MTTTDQATARSTISAYTRSRAAALSSFESASPGTRPRRPAGSTQAAATSGPAQAPRPASSAPAIAPKPRRRRRRSMSHSSSAGGSGEAGAGREERRPIAVRPYAPDRSRGRRDTRPRTDHGPVPAKGTGPGSRTVEEADRRGGRPSRRQTVEEADRRGGGPSRRRTGRLVEGAAGGGGGRRPRGGRPGRG